MGREASVWHPVHGTVIQRGDSKFVVLSQFTQRGDGKSVFDAVSKATTLSRLFAQKGRIDLFTHGTPLNEAVAACKSYLKIRLAYPQSILRVALGSAFHPKQTSKPKVQGSPTAPVRHQPPHQGI